MRVAVHSFNLDGKTRTRFASDKRVRAGTPRSAWPLGSRLYPRLAVGREPPEVTLIRRFAPQCRMRAMLVIPFQHHGHLALYAGSARRNDEPLQRFFKGS